MIRYYLSLQEVKKLPETTEDIKSERC